MVWRWASVVAVLLPAHPAWAQEEMTLDKVRRTGTLVLGVREASYPLSYLGDGEQPMGYHLDICDRIAEAVKTKLKLPSLRVAHLPVTSANRIASLIEGTIDLECGSTTNNAARQKVVRFAPTTYVTFVRMAVTKRSGIETLQSLNHRIVVTTKGSDSLALLRAATRPRHLDFAEVSGADHAQSFAMLESGQADAFINDDNLLAGLIAASAHPEDFRIIGPVLGTSPIAVMLRRDDPAFEAVVDDTVTGLMTSGEINRLYTQWFLEPIPPKGLALNIPMGETLKTLIRFPSETSAESFAPPE